ncbi:MAG: GNAT family N-acetyltransferase [Armatimonadota bacterium]|nr:MAG: GNAT family N-acetyltransferase [Armatimonadota bacterium]
MPLTSPNGTPITVRPIEPEHLDRIVLRCWPDRDTLARLFAEQGTIGMAAWEGDKSVGLLHCYRVTLPDWTTDHWPQWSRWCPDPTWWSEAARSANLALTGPAWCHACCHVGRTLESSQEEALPSGWDKGICKGIDTRYLGRGIGTALCKASIQWARQHDYAAVVAPAPPNGLFKLLIWSGGLPWTSYAKLGFDIIGYRTEVGWTTEPGDELPRWAQGDSPPEVMAEARAALAAGRPAREFRARLMALDLTKTLH